MGRDLQSYVRKGLLKSTEVQGLVGLSIGSSGKERKVHCE
jgi:hypothetical protein